MKRYGSELEFISRIGRQGEKIHPISEQEQQELRDTVYTDNEYTLHCLSITNSTYIASGFNSYVVKLRNAPKDKL